MADNLIDDSPPQEDPGDVRQVPGGHLRRRVQLRTPHRHASHRHGAWRGRLLLRCRRQRVHRLVHRLRPHDLRPPPQAHPRLDRRPDHPGRHAVHVPARARLRGRPQDRPGRARHRAVALRQLRQRGDAGGHPPRARLHRQGQDHEVGGELQRLPRLPRLLARAGARRRRARRSSPHAALAGRHPQGHRGDRRRRAVQRHRRGRGAHQAQPRPAGLRARRADPRRRRHHPAGARLPRGPAPHLRRERRGADLRRDHHRLPRLARRRPGAVRRHPGHHLRGQGGRRRHAGRRRVRRQEGDHGSSRPTAPCCTAAPTAATR